MWKQVPWSFRNTEGCSTMLLMLLQLASVEMVNDPMVLGKSIPIWQHTGLNNSRSNYCCCFRWPGTLAITCTCLGKPFKICRNTTLSSSKVQCEKMLSCSILTICIWVILLEWRSGFQIQPKWYGQERPLKKTELTDKYILGSSHVMYFTWDHILNHESCQVGKCWLKKKKSPRKMIQRSTLSAFWMILRMGAGRRGVNLRIKGNSCETGRLLLFMVGWFCLFVFKCFCFSKDEDTHTQKQKQKGQHQRQKSSFETVFPSRDRLTAGRRQAQDSGHHPF